MKETLLLFRKMISGTAETFAIRVSAFPVPVLIVIPVAHRSSATRFTAVLGRR